jgi:hypothetical protein
MAPKESMHILRDVQAQWTTTSPLLARMNAHNRLGGFLLLRLANRHPDHAQLVYSTPGSGELTWGRN